MACVLLIKQQEIIVSTAGSRNAYSMEWKEKVGYSSMKEMKAAFLSSSVFNSAWTKKKKVVFTPGCLIHYRILMQTT